MYLHRSPGPTTKAPCSPPSASHYKVTGKQQYFERGSELINAVREHSSLNGILVEVMCNEEGSCNFD